MVKIEYIVLEFHQGYDFFHKIAIKNCINEVEIALQNEILIFFPGKIFPRNVSVWERAHVGRVTKDFLLF